MKNQILDIPFRESFSDFLEKGETIIWEGYPKSLNAFGNIDTKDEFEYHRFIALLSIGLILFTYLANIPFPILFSFFTIVLLVIIFPKLNRKNKRNFKYVITQKQILFQMTERWKTNIEVHSIPFSEIKEVLIVKTFDTEKWKSEFGHFQEGTPTIYYEDGIEKLGTVFIVPYQPKSIKFVTTDLMNNENRHLPTLELLADVDKVAKIIRDRIQNVNA